MIIRLSQPPLHYMPRKRKDLGKGKREAIYKQISSPTPNNKNRTASQTVWTIALQCISCSTANERQEITFILFNISLIKNSPPKNCTHLHVNIIFNPRIYNKWKYCTKFLLSVCALLVLSNSRYWLIWMHVLHRFSFISFSLPITIWF